MESVLNSINSYYSEKIKKHGLTPQGVDWKDEEGQLLRFKQLLKVVNQNNHFSLNDLGCGYGSLLDYCADNGFSDFRYCGYDLSDEMISKAIESHKPVEQHLFKTIKTPEYMEIADYTVASGIFNVKMHYKDYEWLYYILHTIDIMNNKSYKGFAFNVLTKYSDKEYMRDDLFYADPCFFFDYCKTKYSRKVSILHDYELYEFTMIVKK